MYNNQWRGNDASLGPRVSGTRARQSLILSTHRARVGPSFLSLRVAPTKLNGTDTAVRFIRLREAEKRNCLSLNSVELPTECSIGI